MSINDKFVITGNRTYLYKTFLKTTSGIRSWSMGSVMT